MALAYWHNELLANTTSQRNPNKFTGRYGSCLSSPVFLKPPDGKEWKVHWTKHDNEVWFQDDWMEFASLFSLDEGHLVLFKYEGTCQFDVLIFNNCALEIDYLSSSKNNLSDDTVEALDDMPANRKAVRKTPLSSSRPCKKMRSLQNLPVAFKTNPGQCQGTEFQKSTNAELKLCKQEPEGGANKFAERHLKKDCGVVQLEALDGRTWPARYKIPRIEDGWEKFVMKNDLKWVKKRTCNLAEDLKAIPFKKEQISSMQQTSSFKYENPHFMDVPSQFSRTHLHDCTKSVKLLVQDADWPVEYVVRITYPGSQVREFSCGWKRFCQDNALKLGSRKPTQFIAA
ncbi:B3 domain-containing transcription factor VRN1-like [Prosopis cineraria]|uniref:B3 domain-containing transcription factor VRN1-like n=1 Tax=Prosopis cineraria TaxID=364024 RepID=UPI00240F06E6|nr:B3 domain-containing transcription factor VRN1-like [Prosopis cineraria]